MKVFTEVILLATSCKMDSVLTSQTEKFEFSHERRLYPKSTTHCSK